MMKYLLLTFILLSTGCIFSDVNIPTIENPNDLSVIDMMHDRRDVGKDARIPDVGLPLACDVQQLCKTNQMQCGTKVNAMCEDTPLDCGMCEKDKTCNSNKCVCAEDNLEDNGKCYPKLIEHYEDLGQIKFTGTKSDIFPKGFNTINQIVPFLSSRVVDDLTHPVVSHTTIETFTKEGENKYKLSVTIKSNISSVLNAIQFNPKFAKVYRGSFKISSDKLSTAELSVFERNKEGQPINNAGTVVATESTAQKMKIDPKKSFLVFYTRAGETSTMQSSAMVMGKITAKGTLVFSRGKKTGAIFGNYFVVEAKEDAFSVQHFNSISATQKKSETKDNYQNMLQDYQSRMLLWSNLSNATSILNARIHCDTASAKFVCKHNATTKANPLKFSLQAITFNTPQINVESEIMRLGSLSNSAKHQNSYPNADLAIPGQIGVAGAALIRPPNVTNSRQNYLPGLMTVLLNDNHLALYRKSTLGTAETTYQFLTIK